jgi:hypothetical protein
MKKAVNALKEYRDDIELIRLVRRDKAGSKKDQRPCLWEKSDKTGTYVLDRP